MEMLFPTYIDEKLCNRKSPGLLNTRVGKNNTESFKCCKFHQVSMIWANIPNEIYCLRISGKHNCGEKIDKCCLQKVLVV